MKKKSIKGIFVLVAVVIIIIITVTTIIIHKNNNNSVEIESEKNNEVLISSVDKKSELTGDSNFLFACIDRKNDSIIFSAVLEFKPFSKEIKILPINKNLLFEDKSLEEIYSFGGVTGLESAVNKMFAVKIDRYVLFDKSDFCNAITVLGNLPYTIDEEYTYESSDKTYNVEIGEKSLDSYMLYTYLTILSSRNDEMKSISELYREIVSYYISQTEKKDSLRMFNQLINSVTTDMSATDFYRSQKTIEVFLDSEINCYIDLER